MKRFPTDVRGAQLCSECKVLRKVPKPVGIAIALACVPPFFCQTFFDSTALQLLPMMIALLILAFYAFRARLVFDPPKIILAWTGLLLLILLNNNHDLSASLGSMKWYLAFLICLLVALTLSAERSIGWMKLVFLSIVSCAFIHAFTTIVTWLFPSIYDEVVYPMFFSDQITVAGRGYRAGFTAHYSTNGMYLAEGFLSAFALTLLDCGGKTQKRFYLIVCAIMLFALLLTTKRAHLVFGLLSAIIVYSLYHSQRKLSASVKLMLAVVVFLAFLYIASWYIPDLLVVFDRLAEASEDDTIGGRSSFYELCLTMWSDSAVLGNGWGSYTEMFNKTALGSYYVARGFVSMDAHNVYLQLLAEEGLVGFALFLLGSIGCLALAIKGLIDLNKRKAVGMHDDHDLQCIDLVRACLAGSIGVQLFFLLYCMTGNPLYDMQMYVPYLLSCAIPLSSMLCNVETHISTTAHRETGYDKFHVD